jgi:bacterioferritin-associated ferredoxin
LQTLAQNLPLAPAIALLSNCGFSSPWIEEILRLPHYAWHKSWWYALDRNGEFTLPFLRYIRTLHYPDGTITLQYKDFFEYEKPDCFTSQLQTVLVVIRLEVQGFGETLQRINRQRADLSTQRAILICNTISELEAQAFISQGISVYPAMDLALPAQANCQHCGCKECPMNGFTESLVATCYGYTLESEFV